MMADALVYGQTIFKPSLVIDVATFTSMYNFLWYSDAKVLLMYHVKHLTNIELSLPRVLYLFFLKPRVLNSGAK